MQTELIAIYTYIYIFIYIYIYIYTYIYIYINAYLYVSSPPTRDSPSNLQFASKLYCGSLSSFHCPPPSPHLQCPPCCNKVARPLRNIRPPPPPTHPLYTIHHTILVMAISCKSQTRTRRYKNLGSTLRVNNIHISSHQLCLHIYTIYIYVLGLTRNSPERGRRGHIKIYMIYMQ